MGGVNSAEDTREYREGYPNKVDDANAVKNLQFYRKCETAIRDAVIGSLSACVATQ
jgi:hypothetical protein